MNVKRKVSEQAVEGTEQRRSRARRRVARLARRRNSTANNFPWLVKQIQYAALGGGLYSGEKDRGKEKRGKRVYTPPPPPPGSGLCHGLDSTRILPQLIPGLSQLTANRQPHKKSSQVKSSGGSHIQTVWVLFVLLSYMFDRKCPPNCSYSFLFPVSYCQGFCLDSISPQRNTLNPTTTPPQNNCLFV